MNKLIDEPCESNINTVDEGDVSSEMIHLILFVFDGESRYTISSSQ